MSKQRLIAKVPNGLFGMTQEARDEINAKIRAWYDAAIGPCAIPWESGIKQWVIFKRPKPLEGSDDE